MSKYQLLETWDLESNVLQDMDPELTESEIEDQLAWSSPSIKWEDCYPVMDLLLEMTGGVLLKPDGSATAEINGKQETATGGHCRAICILYLMAKDAENDSKA